MYELVCMYLLVVGLVTRDPVNKKRSLRWQDDVRRQEIDTQYSCTSTFY
jgi:hypothetical protein